MDPFHQLSLHGAVMLPTKYWLNRTNRHIVNEEMMYKEFQDDCHILAILLP